LSVSYDLHVFGATALDAAEVGAVAETVGKCRIVSGSGPSGGFVVERQVRATFNYAFDCDGPFRIEHEDLPDAVISSAIGVRWVYQLSVGGSSAPGKQLASEFARVIAQRSGGVVYDPQQEAIVFPRGGTRRFKPEPTAKLDLVQFKWFARREDVTPELPINVFDLIRSHLPEALPRRFGNYEPLQGSLDEAGKDGFVAAWRAEQMLLFWKGSPPCLGGSMSGLGDKLVGIQHAGPHPVGSIGLSFDCRAFLDDRWTDDAIALFVAISERLPAFFAHAEVDRNVDYSRGNVWYGPDAVTNPGLVVRNVWMGLPCFDLWLWWFGRLYRAIVQTRLPPGLTELRETGALVRTSKFPLEEGDAGWRPPEELALKATGSPPGNWDRERADVLPSGL
jgi:hypothetical protein